MSAGTRTDTIPSFFENSCSLFPENIYLWEKTGEKYGGMTYSGVRSRVCRFAAGLIRLGIRPGDRVALISEGRNDWVTGELGILYAGAVNVPLSVKLTEPEELKFRLDHSGARMVIASGPQAAKIRDVRKALPSLGKVILLDDTGRMEEDEILFEQVLAYGSEFLESDRPVFESRWRSVKPDDLANICYTSGTTADPKGIMLTHGNYIENVRQCYSLMDIRPDYRTLLILPWDHAFAHTAGIYCFMGKGASVASVQRGKTAMESLRNIPANIREIAPQILLSVPSLAENFKNNIERSIRERGLFILKLFRVALKLAYWHNRSGSDRGAGITFLARPLLKAFNLLLFRRIREGFGGRLEFFIGGGALLDMEYQRFFYALGIPMLQGYGLTEAAPVISSNSLQRHKLGSSGRVAGQLDVKICNDRDEPLPPGMHGEIAVRGGNVMKGYWRNDEATRQSLRDGWLYTGDLGYLDQDGFLYVLGRYKSLLIANDGEKYSPEGMEEAFSGDSPYILQCMLFNNQGPYTVILVVPDRANLVGHLLRHGFTPSSDEGLDEALALLGRSFREYRAGGRFDGKFPQRWLPAVVGVLPEPFTEENRMINSTLKMVRGRIVEKYRPLIDFLYTPGSRDIRNPLNREAIRSILAPGGP